MKRKLTFTIKTVITNKFNEAIKRAGLRRDSYLNQVLPAELDELKPLEANTEKGEKQLRDIRRFLCNDFSKVNVSIDEEVAAKLDKVCSEKHIPRDLFIEEVMNFLVSGPENKSCAAPLAMIYELRNNPRYEYSPDPDEKTPYDWLSISDDIDHPDFEKARNLLKNALKQSRKK